MGVSAVVENGEVVTSASKNSLNAKSAGAVDKEDFLQLLVAQMQYQDPLEPTDNTQWVTQYAQFSQVEEMQNMSTSMSLSRASALVGQTVIMNVTDAKGNETQVQGNVDYVSYESGKAYLSINGGLYSLDDLSLVVDDTYLSGMKAATDFVNELNKLPSLTLLGLSDKDAVDAVTKQYEALTEYQLSFLENTDYKTTLQQYRMRIAQLEEAANS